MHIMQVSEFVKRPHPTTLRIRWEADFQIPKSRKTFQFRCIKKIIRNWTKKKLQFHYNFFKKKLVGNSFVIMKTIFLQLYISMDISFQVLVIAFKVRGMWPLKCFYFQTFIVRYVFGDAIDHKLLWPRTTYFLIWIFSSRFQFSQKFRVLELLK